MVIKWQVRQCRGSLPEHTGLCSKKRNRLAIGDAHSKYSSQRPGRAKAPRTGKSILRDSTRVDYARSRSVNKEAEALARPRGEMHTATTAEEVDLDGNPLHIFK